MKLHTLTSRKWNRWLLTVPLALSVATSAAIAAEGDTNAAPEQATAPEPAEPAEAETPAPEGLTPEQFFEGGAETYKNWIEFGVGGFIVDGNKGQFQQNHRTSGDPFGGIQDFHYQQDLGKGTAFSADGRALFNENDYGLNLNVTKEKLGYLRFSYDEFRTWYQPHGGFFGPTERWYERSDEAKTLDRGEISFEAGLRLENVPQVTFTYTRTFRDGAKNSTIWGFTHPTDDTPVRGISPTINDIDEHTDIFTLDATHKIKATALGLGLRYETGEIDNALKIRQWPGEVVERAITDQQRTDFDLFNVHAFSETWMRTNVMLSAGFSYTDLDNDFSGSRIYGSDFDVSYAPNALNGAGYFDLNGGSRLHEYVFNLNLFTQPLKNFTVVPSVRVQREDMDASSEGMATTGTAAPTPFSADSERGVLDVRERLDLTYNGITNWVFYARGELTQGEGDLEEIGGTGSPINRETDDERFFQKYSAGARWYPLRSLTIDAGGYYKNNNYDYDHEEDNTPNDSANRYPAYLEMQNFETYDGNLRVRVRPRRNVTLISRYEYQRSMIDTKPAGLSEVESSDMTSHILAQDINWSPWSRLYLQVGFNYVISETETPASDVTRAILDANNNYWTVNFTTGLVLDDKTDLKVGYTYYEADNFEDNYADGLPLESGASEHGVTATLVRKLSKNLRLQLRYGYYHYEDAMFGGKTDYDAHLIYSSLQYRF